MYSVTRTYGIRDWDVASDLLRRHELDSCAYTLYMNVRWGLQRHIRYNTSSHTLTIHSLMYVCRWSLSDV